MKEKPNFLLTWYNDVFNVIVEGADGEITAKGNHLNSIEFVRHVEKPNRLRTEDLHYTKTKHDNKLIPTKSTSQIYCRLPSRHLQLAERQRNNVWHLFVIGYF